MHALHVMDALVNRKVLVRVMKSCQRIHQLPSFFQAVFSPDRWVSSPELASRAAVPHVNSVRWCQMLSADAFDDYAEKEPRSLHQGREAIINYLVIDIAVYAHMSIIAELGLCVNRNVKLSTPSRRKGT